MSYPLIILGAGSSYDYLKITRLSSTDQHTLNPWRAPVINDIFDISRFSRIIGKYEDIKPLASEIINIKDSKKPFNFEEHITELEKKFPDNTYKAVMALRFYLSELFGKVSHHFFFHTNNHNHLINEINKKAGRACFLNFNYDTLLEKNLKEIGMSNEIDSYVKGNIKIIKIHGAYNWSFDPIITEEKKDVYDYFTSNAKELNTIYASQGTYPKTVGNFDYKKYDFNINKFRKHSREYQWHYYLPAIAVPIGTKSHFVCPNNHISILEKELKEIDRILTIGWKAQDKFALSLLKKNLSKNIPLTIVSSNKSSANKIALKFKNIKQIDFGNIEISNSSGYTDFMINGEYEKFFS